MACTHLLPVDPRVRRTRQLLQDALRELLCQKSFESISVQDITKAATVNRATFYAHYPDKQALLKSAVLAEFQEFMLQRWSEKEQMSPESLTKVATWIIEFVGGLGGGCPAAAKELGHAIELALQEELHGMFKHWLEHGKPAALADHPSGVIATVLSWSIYGAAYRWAHGSRKRSPGEVAETVVNLLLQRRPAIA